MPKRRVTELAARPDPAPMPSIPLPPSSVGTASTDQTLVMQLASKLAGDFTIGTIHSILGTGTDIAEEAVRALLEMDGIRKLLQIPNARPWTRSPMRIQMRQNLVRRAAYLVNAARRLTTALSVGKPSPQPRTQRLAAALERERTLLRQHLEATTKRLVAARAVGDAAEQYGNLLGWYAINDDRTTAECRQASGRNFNPLAPPLIGYPGTVHPHCRCKPGPPHRTDQMVAGSGPARNLEVAASMVYGRTKALQVIKPTPEYKGRHRMPETIDLVKSSAYPDLERVPGKQNWVDKAGGLPDYIERIAKHLHYEQGMSISRAIAVAVNTVKRWARGGTVTEGGTTKTVSATTQAKAAKAVAEWEAKKAKSRD